MKFSKIFLATLLAVLVSGVISSLFSLIFFFGILGSMESTTTAAITPQTILKIDFAENISEAPTKNPMAGFDYNTMTMSKNTHLLKVLQAIETAKKDSRIKGIYLNFTGMGGVTTGALEEIRAALIDFKQGGKFVVAYNEGYSQGSYYLASVADKIYLHPEGGFSWIGMAQTSLFMKGAFDKLGLNVEAIRPTACKYKSAVEPYIRHDMSPENRAQMQMMVDDFWGVLVGSIAESRKLDAQKLMVLADKLEVTQPEDALKEGFVDALIYEDEMDGKFAEYGVEKGSDDKYNIVSLGEYITLNPAIAQFGVPSVGIIYAEGQIMDGNMYTDGYVFGSRLADELRQARYDDNTKAVVVRVNSPGGSALASDVAWREMSLLQQTKPVVISMGDMAASGGYYISAPADYIFADKTTLTGSIGVFGAMFNIEKTLKNKLGVTTDSALTSPSASGITPFKALTKEQRDYLNRGVDDVYTTFTEHVAEGRNLPIDDVLKIAEGRVWSGSNAVEIGLVDEIGGFTQAVAKATELAGISKRFALYEFNAELSPFEMWLEGMSATATVNMGISENSIYFDEIRNFIIANPMLITNGGIQAKLPGDIEIDF